RNFFEENGIGTRKEKRGQETNEEGQSKLPNSTKDRRTRTEKGDISKELRKGTFLKSFDSLGDLRLTGLADYRMVSAKDDSKSQVPARASSVQGPSG
ncbi:MAG: hypothetical protein DMG49_05150, partial [Acidobacteria bacterium]